MTARRNIAAIAGGARVLQLLGGPVELPPVTQARIAARRFALLDELDDDGALVDGVDWRLADEPEAWGLDAEALREVIEPGWEHWREAGEVAAFTAWCEAGGDGEDFPGRGLDPQDCRLLTEIAECVALLLKRDAAPQASPVAPTPAAAEIAQGEAARA